MTWRAPSSVSSLVAGDLTERCHFFFCFLTLVTGPIRSSSLKLSDARVYEPQIRAHLGTTFGKGLSGGDQDAFRFQDSGCRVLIGDEGEHVP